MTTRINNVSAIDFTLRLTTSTLIKVAHQRARDIHVQCSYLFEYFGARGRAVLQQDVVEPIAFDVQGWLCPTKVAERHRLDEPIPYNHGTHLLHEIVLLEFFRNSYVAGELPKVRDYALPDIGSRVPDFLEQHRM